MIENAVSIAGGTAKLIGDELAMLLTQHEDMSGSIGGLLTHDGNASEKEGQPGFPITVVAHCLEMFVVLLAIAFEVVGEVEHWLEQNFPFAEKEGDQKASNSTIAIQKRVDRLKLSVREPNLDQEWERRIRMEEAFEFGQSLWHFVRWWRDKDGLGKSAAAGANPVLGRTQFVWSPVLSANASE